MFIVFFALWVILNGKWTTEIGVFGLVFASVMYLFTWKYMGFGPKVDFALVRRVPSALRYGVTLLREIVMANVAVIKMIFSENEVKPQLVRFHVPLKKNRHLVALANSITLTPGTITVDLQDNLFTVHALDESLVEGLDDGVFVQQLIEMEKKHGHQIAQPTAAAAQGEASAAEETAGEAAEETVIETEPETQSETETETEINAETETEADAKEENA